ncbi:MAG: UbiA family prenyltransferase [Phycisphaeraceae bacterium]
MKDKNPDNPAEPAGPLIVDLDGTLVATDTLHESLLEIAGRRLTALLQVAGALTQGKARFKAKVGDLAELDAAALPYRERVLGLIREAKSQGRPVVLASASHGSVVDAVADHLGLFDATIATIDLTNRKGAGKLEAIRDLLTERNWGGMFDYVGDHRADLPIWAEAQTAYLVDADVSTARRVKPKGDTVVLVGRRAGQFAQLVRAGRPHQWCKNLLLAVPFLSAQEAGLLIHWFEFLAAFLAFGLCASAVYLVNDLLDLRSDRLHPTKRRRPMAAGKLPVRTAALAAPLLVLFAVVGSAVLLPIGFVWALLVYTASAWLYSFAVKNKAILDVVWLGCLYTLRVIAGGLATSTPVSEWLLALALFLFLSIALAKRYAELRLLGAEGRKGAAGRNYAVDDQQLLSVMGVGAGMLGVLVLALYINSRKVSAMYEHPEALWIVCPLMLYWVGRLWMRAHRRMMRDDPLLFALTDKASYIIALLVILAAMIAA